MYFEKLKLKKKIGQVIYFDHFFFFCGRIATEQKLAHPQASDGLQAKIEVVNERQPLVTHKHWDLKCTTFYSAGNNGCYLG